MLFFFVAVAGCASLPKTYSSQARPIYPTLGTSVSDFYEKIDTLEPVLKWTDVKSPGQTYDVAVWETSSRASDKSILGTPLEPRDWGTQIYYAQALSQNFYKISKPLKPNTCYHWSVRIRTGTRVSKWATFNQSAVSLLGVGYAYHMPYGFITPRQ
jgi:hypothetical protein